MPLHLALVSIPQLQNLLQPHQLPHQQLFQPQLQQQLRPQLQPQLQPRLQPQYQQQHQQQLQRQLQQQLQPQLQQLFQQRLVQEEHVNMKDKNCHSLEIATNIIDVSHNLMVNLTLKFSIVETGSLIKIKDLVFGQVLTMTFVQMNQIFSDFSMKIFTKI